MNQTLNEDGMLLPGPSKSGQSSRDNNEETLLASDSDFESGQRSSDRKHRHRKVRDMQDIPNKKSRHHRYIASTQEKKVEKSESSIKKLKEHTEKKTYPKDLRYNVRVNVVQTKNLKVTPAIFAEKLDRNLSARWHATTTDEQKATKSSSNVNDWSKAQT